jgi:hypothetical protein
MTQRKYFMFVSLMIVFCAFLRFFMLTNQSLWFDEGWSLYYSSGQTLVDCLRKLTQTPNSEHYQPLYFVVLFFYRRLFGDSEFALRALSVIFGVGAATFLFFAALQFYGGKRALWSLVFFCVSSYAVYYSQEVRPYALLLFLGSIQLFLFAKVLHDNNSSHPALWRWLFGVVTCVEILASIFLLLFTLALSLSHLLVHRDGKHWIKLWPQVGLSCMPAAVYYIYFVLAARSMQPKATGLTQPIVQNILFVPYGILVGQSFGPPMEMLRGEDRIGVVFSYWPELLAVLLVVVTIGVSILLILHKQTRLHNPLRIDYLFVWLSVISFCLSALFSFLNRFNWQPRHAFFLVSPAAILISLPFDEPEKYGKEFRKLFRYARLAVIFLICLNLVSLFNYYFDKKYQRDDYRAVANYLTAHSSIPSILLWGMPELLQYYGDAHTIDGRGFNRRNVSPQVREITSDADTVFLAISREFYWGRTNAVRDAMDSLYTYVDKRSFPYFSIYTFVRRP